jgi:hypothetical protein
VHDVAAALGNDLSNDWHSQQRKIADDVQDLVPHKLIAKAPAGYDRDPHSTTARSFQGAAIALRYLPARIEQGAVKIKCKQTNGH